jgi:hypothetical protein
VTRHEAVLADRIRQIWLDAAHSGTALPGKRTLARQLRASRPAVREPSPGQPAVGEQGLISGTVMTPTCATEDEADTGVIRGRAHRSYRPGKYQA